MRRFLGNRRISSVLYLYDVGVLGSILGCKTVYCVFTNSYWWKIYCILDLVPLHIFDFVSSAREEGEFIDCIVGLRSTINGEGCLISILSCVHLIWEVILSLESISVKNVCSREINKFIKHFLFGKLGEEFAFIWIRNCDWRFLLIGSMSVSLRLL